MAFPEGWPPRYASGVRSIRYFKEGVATTAFADNAFLFSEQSTANPFKPTPYVEPGESSTIEYGDLTSGSGSPMGGGRDPRDANTSQTDPAKQAVPVPMIWCFGLRIVNRSDKRLEISFDGVNIHGVVLPNATLDAEHLWRTRYEAGISIRSTPTADALTFFTIEAW